jgi:hypothetical protein
MCPARGLVTGREVIMRKRTWFTYPLFPDRFQLGDAAPSGTCRHIADFTPHSCVTGAGDESPTEKEARANLKLAAAAPRLFEAMKNLLECPDLNLDELEPDTETAIKEAHAALQAADTNEFVEPDYFVFVRGGFVEDVTDIDGAPSQGKVAVIDFDILNDGVCPICHDDTPPPDSSESWKCPGCGYDLKAKDQKEAIDTFYREVRK